MSESPPELSVDAETELHRSLISHEAPNGTSRAEETPDLESRYAELQTCYQLAWLAANSLSRATSASSGTENDLRRAAGLISYGNEALSRSMLVTSEVARTVFLQAQANILKNRCDFIRSRVVRSETRLRALSAIELAGQRAGGSCWDGVPLDAHTVNLYTDSIALCLENVQEGLSASDAAGLSVGLHEWKPPSTIGFQVATTPDESGKSVQDIADSLSSLIESAYLMGLAFKREYHADHPEEMNGGLTPYETELLAKEGITELTSLEMGDLVAVMGVDVQFLGGSSDI